MSKIRTFFYVLSKSFTSPSYYADVLKAPFSFSLKFFYFYFLLYAIVGTTLFSFAAVPKINKFVTSFSEKITDIYPEELVITLKDGEVSTNVPEPYIISAFDVKKIFEDANVLGAKTPDIINLLVIDTKAAADDFTRYQTFSLLTNDKLVVYDDKGGYRVYPLNEAGDATINKKVVLEILSVVKPYFRWITPALVFFIFIALFIFIPSTIFFYLLFGSLVLWIAGKILSYPLSYKKTYQMAMHLVLIPTTVFGVISLFGGHVSFPFLRTIILTVMGIVVLLEIKKKQPVVPVPIASSPPPPAGGSQ